MTRSPEDIRLTEDERRGKNWKRFGPHWSTRADGGDVTSPSSSSPTRESSTRGRSFDVSAEYAKRSPDDILIRITVANRGPEAATIQGIQQSGAAATARPSR